MIPASLSLQVYLFILFFLFGLNCSRHVFVFSCSSSLSFFSFVSAWSVATWCGRRVNYFQCFCISLIFHWFHQHSTTKAMCFVAPVDSFLKFWTISRRSWKQTWSEHDSKTDSRRPAKSLKWYSFCNTFALQVSCDWKLSSSWNALVVRMKTPCEADVCFLLAKLNTLKSQPASTRP